MYIIFNHDGSIKNLNLNEIIVQGNNLVNEIQIGIEGRTPDDYVATAYFTLPDGTSNYITGSADNFSIDQSPYSGYSINLTSAQTVMAGEVGMTIQCEDANSHVLCTYKVKLTVNESGYIPEATTITMAQLQSLLATLSTYQLKYVAPNVRSYPSLEDAEEDLENLADKQIIVIGDTEDDTPSTPVSFYYKYNDDLVPFDFGYGFIELDIGEVSGYLTDFQTAQARKSVCFIKRGSAIYYAQESYSGGATRYFYAIPLWATGSAYEAKFIEVGFYDNQTTWDYGETKVYTDAAPTDGSLNLVTSNGVYDAIATAIANLKSLIEGEISALDDLGIVVIDDANNHESGMLDSYQQSQAQKPYVIIKYINSDDLVTYFVSQFDYDDETPNTKSFQSILGWGSSSEEGISGQYESSTIVIDDLYTEYPSWELNTNTQKVDEEPTDGSWNLVTSNGVYDAIASAKSTIEGEISTAIEGVQSEITSLTRTLIHKDDYSTSSASFDAYGVAPKALSKASLDGFLGNSVVRNQQYNVTYSNTVFNVTTNVVNGVVSISGTSDSSGNGPVFSWTTFKFPAGHKFIVLKDFNLPQGDYLFDQYNSQAGTDIVGKITTASNNFIILQLHVANANVAYNISNKHIYIIDLTQWFGSNDLIPADLLSTPALFLSKYAYGMDLSYNTGTLVDGTLTKLKANGFNVWDEESETTTQEGSSRLTSKNYIPVFPGTQYYAKTPFANNTIGGIWLYDENKNLIKLIYSSPDYVNGAFTTPSNCAFIKFYMTYSYGTTYHNDICINVSNADLNGTYLPHANPIQTSLSIGTMRSAGSVRDTNELTKVGKVDLSTLNWRYETNRFKATAPANMKSVATTAQPNWLCDTKEPMPANISLNTYQNAICYIASDNLLITYASSESAPTPTGTLNYELTTPTARTTAFPELLDIHSGGIIEAEFTDLPIKTQITYLEEE